MVVIAFVGTGDGDVTKVVGPFDSSADADSYLDTLGWTVCGRGRPNVRINFSEGATEISAHVKEVNVPK